jgi:hypothetical protein
LTVGASISSSAAAASSSASSSAFVVAALALWSVFVLGLILVFSAPFVLVVSS